MDCGPDATSAEAFITFAMKKILIIVGTRPEVIKMAPVVEELRSFPDLFKCTICVSGQHREMVDQLLTIFRIKPDHDLRVMTTNQSLSELTAKLFTEIDLLIRR